MSSTAIVLAAGGSSRLGTPKQLVRFDGRTLVARSAESCLDAGCDHVTVVVGCEAEAVAAAVAHLPVNIIRNEAWRSGQASSIHAGIRHLNLGSEASLPGQPERLLITLCDQLAVTPGHLHSLLLRCNNATPIAATSYEDGGGVPACFHSQVFRQLEDISGDQGAKALIRNRRYVVALVGLANVEQDIDIPADLAIFHATNAHEAVLRRTSLLRDPF